MYSKQTKIKKLILAMGVIITLQACQKQPILPPSVENEPEVFTTVQLTFTDTITNTNLTYKFKDIDGPGGNNPVIDTLKLDKNKTYILNVTLFDDTKNPVVNMTDEIKELGTEHQFFYENTAINFTYLDFDSKSNPIGLKTRWKVNDVVQNNATKFTLKHQPLIKPDKPGNINIGETDIEILFPTQIK
jgi:hypothetical protein